MTALLHTSGQLAQPELRLKQFHINTERPRNTLGKVKCCEEIETEGTDDCAKEAISFHEHLHYRVAFYIQ